MARASPWAALVGVSAPALLAAVLLQGCGGDGPDPAPAPSPAPALVEMDSVVSKEEQYEIIEGLFDLAQEWAAPMHPNGTRDRSKGYMKSLEYVQTKLAEVAATTDFEITPQVLPYEDTFWIQLAPIALHIDGKPYVEEFPYKYIRSSLVNGNGTAIGAPFQPTFDKSGCNESDYGDLTGQIAILEAMSCGFSFACNKIQHAVEAGAVGVIVFEPESATDLRRGQLRFCPPVVPFATVTYAVGQELLAASSIRLEARSEWVETASSNLCLDLPGGDKDKVVMIGAHLDSMPDGPGANDNGSGSALVLEIARAFLQRYSTTGLLDRVKNSLRICWWGSEEYGMIGSGRWVNMSSQAELDKILGYINFDMMAGPNGCNMVNRGTDDMYNPNASEYIQQALGAAFEARGEPWKTTWLSGSDFYSFYEVKVPMGGILSGSSGLCTEEEASIFGCTVGIAHDPCYHKHCDVPTNVDQDRQLLFSQVAAKLVQDFIEDDQLSTKLARQNLVPTEGQKQMLAELLDAEPDSEELELEMWGPRTQERPAPSMPAMAATVV